jgi:hypothetical protein
VSAAAAQEPAPTVVVEFEVAGRGGTPIVDLKPPDVRILQDDVAQTILALQPTATAGRYQLRYVPASGQPGAVLLRVLRAGAVAAGPDGGPLRIKVEAPLTPLEQRLVPLLDASPPAAGLEHHPTVLRFERDGDKVHHTFAVEVPLAKLTLSPAGAVLRGRLGLLAQVKTESGQRVERFSQEYPIEVETSAEERLRAERLVWTSHVHLPAGTYVLETAVADLDGAGASVLRTAFQGPAMDPGLRLSSVTVLAPGGSLAVEVPSADNPLQREDRQLLPSHRRQLVSGGEEQLPFYVVIYPDPAAPEPPQASLELYRSGALVARGTIALPSGTGSIPYVGSFPVAKLAPGPYEMKVVVRHGGAVATESAAFEMIPPIGVRNPDEPR